MPKISLHGMRPPLCRECLSQRNYRGNYRDGYDTSLDWEAEFSSVDKSDDGCKLEQQSTTCWQASPRIPSMKRALQKYRLTGIERQRVVMSYLDTLYLD